MEWKDFFNSQRELPYYQNLHEKVLQEYNCKIVYPPLNLIYNAFKLIIPILSLFFTTIAFSKKAINKGYLEGLKIGCLNIIVFIIITSLTKQGFSLRMTIYFIILLITSALGGMIGINQKE